MKKLFFALLIITGINANAQVYILGGLNFANITRTNDGQTEKNNMLTSFNAGIMGRFDLSDPVDLESGLLLTGRGSRAETYFNGGNDYVKTKFNPLYVEIPLNLVVKVPGGNSGLFFHAGPYVAIGVAGKSKTDSKIGPLSSSATSDIEFSNDDPFTSRQDDAAYDKLKRFDFGLNFGGGISLNKVMIRLNYGLGLAKINSTEGDNSVNDKNKYRTLGLSLGIPIGK